MTKMMEVLCIIFRKSTKAHKKKKIKIIHYIKEKQLLTFNFYRSDDFLREKQKRKRWKKLYNFEL